MKNPQFPHWCKVFRFEKNPLDQYADSTLKVVLEGVCQNQLNAVGDTIWRQNVLYSDYTAYLPINTVIDGFVKQGDSIEVKDGSRTILGIVTQFERGNLGIRIWFDNQNGVK